MWIGLSDRVFRLVSDWRWIVHDGRTRRVAQIENGDAGEAFFDENCVTLVVLSGRGAGSEHALEAAKVCIGRSPAADLPFCDDAMSSEHAVFELVGDVIRVRDLASTNGVRVNGGLVLSADLEHGDRLQIGGHEFQYLLEKRSHSPRAFVVGDVC